MIPLRDNIPSRTRPVINYLLILACAWGFLLQIGRDRAAGPALAEQYGMVPARLTRPGEPVIVHEAQPVQVGHQVELAVRERELPPPPIHPLWTLLTAIFLHGGLLHFVGNMWFLLIFGDNVEDRLGHFRYLLFYLLCGLAGNVGHLLFNWESMVPAIGASGAIAGVMGAYILLYPHARVMTLLPILFYLHFTVIPAWIFLGIWFVLQFMQGSMSLGHGEATGVAWWAHVGGFVFGMAVVLLLRLLGALRPPVRERITRPWQA